MAIPSNRVSYTFRDSEGHDSVVTLYSDATLDDGAGGGLLAEAGNMRSLIEALTDALVVKTEITVQDTNPDTGKPAGNVDNELGARFAFYTEDATVAQVTIPAFKRELLEEDTARVDLSAGAVSAFVNAVVSGDVAVKDSRGADIIGLKSALEAYSRRRRR